MTNMQTYGIVIGGIVLMFSVLWFGALGLTGIIEKFKIDPLWLLAPFAISFLFAAMCFLAMQISFQTK